MCTQRMRYREFATIKWTAPWTGPKKREAERPSSNFIKYVEKCIGKEKKAVEGWASPIKSESPDVSSLVMSLAEYLISFAIALGRNRTYRKIVRDSL
jgi:hypothetical protein